MPALNLTIPNCATANLHSTLAFGFSYQYIECQAGNPNEAYRLCFKSPDDCSGLSAATGCAV